LSKRRLAHRRRVGSSYQPKSRGTGAFRVCGSHEPSPPFSLPELRQLELSRLLSYCRVGIGGSPTSRVPGGGPRLRGVRVLSGVWRKTIVSTLSIDRSGDTGPYVFR